MSGETSKSDEFKEIFLSHCCRSSATFATRLEERLHSEGFSAFNCREMKPGVAFRKTILGNAVNCKLMVIFLDRDWDGSVECQLEFETAFSEFKEKQAPQIVPIVVGGFGWKTSDHLYAKFITSFFQCIPQESQSDWNRVFEDVVRECKRICASSTAFQSSPTFPVQTQPPKPSFLYTIEHFVTCELCGNIFRDPKMLPCSHVFCECCLVKWDGKKCAKCSIALKGSIESLPQATRHKKLADAKDRLEVLFSPKVTSEKPSDDNLDQWFSANNFPPELCQALRNEGFEDKKVVLSLTEKDVGDIPGLKLGHRKALLMAIEDKKKDEGTSRDKTLLETPVATLLALLFDDRVLRSGSAPLDCSKFWIGFNEAQRKDFLDQFKTFGKQIAYNENVPDEKAARALQQVAMLLCEAGEFPEAEHFASMALNMHLGEGSSKEYWECKALKVLAMQNRLKQYKFVSRETTPDWQANVMHCDEILQGAKAVVDQAVLCKVMILKMNAVKCLKARQVKVDEKSLLSSAGGLCKKQDRGLHAEFLMTEALFETEQDRQRKKIRKLLEARTECVAVHGEYSELMGRLYHCLGTAFERLNPPATDAQSELHYECYRRAWLVRRHINGMHHTHTQFSADLLEKEQSLVQIARRKGDSLPSDEKVKDDSNDVHFECRMEKVFSFK